MEKTDLTMLLRAASAGDAEAGERAYAELYDQLRGLARSQLRRQGSITLHTVDLVHEAYVKISGNKGVEWVDRSHFLCLAARAMRQILVDHARQKRRIKRGGDAVRLSLEERDAISEQHLDRVLAVDQALDRLGESDQRLASVVECKYFAGFTEPETALAMQISERTVRRLWQTARRHLQEALAT